MTTTDTRNQIRNNYRDAARLMAEAHQLAKRGKCHPELIQLTGNAASDMQAARSRLQDWDASMRTTKLQAVNSS